MARAGIMWRRGAGGVCGAGSGGDVAFFDESGEIDVRESPEEYVEDDDDVYVDTEEA